LYSSFEEQNQLLGFFGPLYRTSNQIQVEFRLTFSGSISLDLIFGPFTTLRSCLTAFETTKLYSSKTFTAKYLDTVEVKVWITLKGWQFLP